MSLIYKLKNFPMPPTSNQMYASVRGRLIKSKLNRLYDYQVNEYLVKNHALIREIKEAFEGKTLEVKCSFVFHFSKIYTKKNAIKKMDHSNRIKAAHDGLAKILEIDDSYFVSTPCEKMWCENEHDEQIEIEIKESELKKWIK